jgi:Putative zinc-finger
MKCFRVDLWGKLSDYENGVLSESDARELEAHFLRCSDCKERLANLRKGQTWAKSIPPVKPQREIWKNIEAALNASPVRRSAAPYMSAAAALLCAFFLLYLLWNRNERDFAGGVKEMRFEEVTIAKIPHSSAPHIVTEGFVSEVHFDPKEGDTLFRLVENPAQPEPFVICEIVQPYQLKPPPVGSRVRVFGVSRFDSKEDHLWFEVHPVLKIQSVHQ